MKIVQINNCVNSGSTGRIAEDIGKLLLSEGHESYIAFGRGTRPSQSNLIRIGNRFDIAKHGLKTAVFDRHGFGSSSATKAFINEIKSIKPDAIGLHNLHGYYINIRTLFEYLKEINIPVVWTLFDCWSFTGHCSYFDDINCNKWTYGCHSCPKSSYYPSSYLFDNSKRNFQDKRALFTSLEKLHLVVHSHWLNGLVRKSFLNSLPIHHIFSGIDLEVFKPDEDRAVRKKYMISDKKVILGVASHWDMRKGLADFIELSHHLKENQVLVLVGLTQNQIRKLPPGIVGISRTENIHELAAIYSATDVFVNPTSQDNFPTTNIEALACGTPVVTYSTGGSPESIDKNTGLVVIEEIYKS